jgi:hypothetical protein
LVNSRLNLRFGILTAIIKRTFERKLGGVPLECSKFAGFISLGLGFGLGFFYFLLFLCFFILLLILVRVPLVLNFFTRGAFTRRAAAVL